MKVHKVGKLHLLAGRKKPPSKVAKDKPYVPLYNTKDCSYNGKKKGRKTNEEKQKLLEENKFIKKTGNYILYFD
tara:strand:- start:131 stop:352 length:222 start_codon:yes stop_codon:yes gene_type:complete